MANAAEQASDRFRKLQSAIDEALSRQSVTIWTSTEGDFNHDGIKDVAAVVSANGSERLLVLAGTADGSYIPLSVSGEFCRVRKFYNLSASLLTKSFDVKGVTSEDANHANSFTFKFRYNANLNDFELVGREDHQNNYDNNSGYRVSINYLTGVAIQIRYRGKSYIERHYTADGTEGIVKHSRRSSSHKEVETKFQQGTPFRLRDFDCNKYWTEDATSTLPTRIDEDFKVQKR